jgi:hypothetical protein
MSRRRNPEPLTLPPWAQGIAMAALFALIVFGDAIVHWLAPLIGS